MACRHSSARRLRASPVQLAALLAAAVAALHAVAPSFTSPSPLLAHRTLATAARWRSASASKVARAARGGNEGLQKGDAVEAVFPDDGNWYPGTLVKVNGDGTWEVKWDNPDGGPETSMCSDVKKYTPPIPLDELQVGQKYTGTVVSVAPFGAFVNFGAEKDGLVHVSAIKEGFVSNIDDEVQPGQEVTVWLKGVTDGKVSLVMVESKLAGGGGRGPRPRADLTPFKDLVWGDMLKGTVVSVTNFGAFVSVEPPNGGEAAQGLVHVSEMTDGFVEDPTSIVSVGQEVDVYVKDVDLNANRLSLSMKSKS